jgi:hypothetical protein
VPGADACCPLHAFGESLGSARLGGVNALWLLLGIAFAAVVFAVLTYFGRRWRP